jgi:hypothetical protein
VGYQQCDGGNAFDKPRVLSAFHAIVIGMTIQQTSHLPKHIYKINEKASIQAIVVVISHDDKAQAPSQYPSSCRDPPVISGSSGRPGRL